MQDTPYGYCHCGCGGKAPVSPQTVRKFGYVKGEPRRYIRNHDKRGVGPKYKVDPETGCWLFTGYIGEKGYGFLRPHGADRMHPAHRVFYEQAKGPIPEGKQLDHLCHDPNECVGGPECLHRRCVNPDHLEPVTNRENSYRGQTRPGSKQKPGRKKKAKPTHCKYGHEFSSENTYVRPDGAWTCKTCRRGHMLRAYYKRQARVAEQKPDHP